MIISISHATWQQLRVISRDRRAAVPGKEIRYTPSRRTKDGSFLDALVNLGLIRVMMHDPDWRKRTYFLTAAGLHAAEFGEYEGESKTGVAKGYA